MKMELKQYNPLFSRVEKDSNEEQKLFVEWYEKKFNKLPMKLRLGLSSDTIEQEIKNLCDQFDVFDWKNIGYVVRIIRDIFSDKIKEDEIKRRLKKEVNLEEWQIKRFLTSIKVVIQSVKKTGEDEYRSLFDVLTLREAVRKYKEVQEQLISREKLDFEGSDYLIPGTVKNWLKNYFQEAGGNKHNVIERGDYLFKSNNVKKLNEEKRNDLEVILKAFDDDSMIVVNKEEKVIDFEESRRLNGDGKDELNRVVNSYDQDGVTFKKKEVKNMISQEVERNNFSKNIEENKSKFKFIKSTPQFDVDEKESIDKQDNNISENSMNNKNVLKLVDKKTTFQEAIKKDERSGQNVLDLSK